MSSDTLWPIVYWLTLAIGALSCLAAAIVLAVDFLASAPPPEPRRTEIRQRLRQLPNDDPPR